MGLEMFIIWIFFYFGEEVCRMLELNLWWQGFLSAIGLYFVFLMGQIIGFYKSKSEVDYDDKEW